jgi:hypothetical protein
MSNETKEKLEAQAHVRDVFYGWKITIKTIKEVISGKKLEK